MSLEIRDKTDRDKIISIKNVTSQTGIPSNFTPLPRSNANKIFFKTNGQQREWVFFENDKFYCIICVCFSLFEKRRLVTGIKYEKNCRITDALNEHENEKQHIYSKNAYADIVQAMSCDSDETKTPSDKRIVITTIMKIIIFQATHG